MRTSQRGSNVDMVLRLNITDRWNRAGSADLISAECQFPDGRIIRWGVTPHAGRSVFYAEDDPASRHPTEIETRELGLGQSVTFHPFRPLRPGASCPTPGRQTVPSPAATACPFGCQNPGKGLSLLCRPALAQAPCPHMTWLAYANAAPFDPNGHLIWVPGLANGVNVVLPHLLQHMTRETIADFLVLSCIDNALLFFNGLHAGASANHLHFQNVTHTSTLAIEMAPRRTEAGLTLLDYPATALVVEHITGPDQIWPMVERLQERAIPFNLIGIGDTLYLIPRNPEYEVVDDFPGSIMASMELAGRVITGDRAVYETMTAVSLARAQRKTTLPSATLLDLVRDR